MHIMKVVTVVKTAAAKAKKMALDARKRYNIENKVFQI